MVCLLQAPTVVRLVVESPLMGHMQGYCMQHHLERTVHWRPFVQELLVETEPFSGMSESLFICCFLPNIFSQEAIGRILRVEIWDKVNNKRKGQEVKCTETVSFVSLASCNADHWKDFAFIPLLVLLWLWTFAAVLSSFTLLSNCWLWGEKSCLICVWEFSVAGNLPLR